MALTSHENILKYDSRNLKSLTYDNHSRYEWGRGYDVLMEPGEIKAICFDEGSTFCIQYTFISKLPTIAFVADQKWTIGALDGAKKVNIFEPVLFFALLVHHVVEYSV